MTRDPEDPAADEGDVGEPIELPVDGVLDLHTFAPRDIGELVPEYLAACAAKDIWQVRIIHGKGRGVQRRHVQALLDRDPLVASHTPADATAGGWGATLVTLKRNP